jgi:two-component system OmpR family sensor kinase
VHWGSPVISPVATKGFVVECDRAGVVTQLLKNDFTIDIQPGMRFKDLLAPQSQTKAHNFITVLLRDGVAYHWEVNLLEAGREKLIYLAGFIEHQRMVIIAAEEPPEILSIVDEMTAINNDYARLLRQEIKRAEAGSRHLDQSANDLESMSALNNELVNMSRRLEKTNQALGKSIEERNRWMGVLAHDLRNPLGIISGYSEFLTLNFSDQMGEKPREIVKTIHTTSQFMLTLLNQLLDLSVIEAGHLALNLEPAEMVTLAKLAVDLNRLMAERKNIILSISASADALEIECDAIKMSQVLHNLIGNAIKFTHSGGSVSVELQCEGPMLVLRVADTGQGIAKDDMARLFTPFQTTRTRPTGSESSTGLGLAICKRIVEGHGGKIDAESTPGLGSVFSVKLPLKRQKPS